VRTTLAISGLGTSASSHPPATPPVGTGRSLFFARWHGLTRGPRHDVRSELRGTWRFGGRITGEEAPSGQPGLYDLHGAEAVERPVDEEDLHRDVGIDVGLGEERHDLRPVSSSITWL
jgi:hypothetical protein